MQLDSILTNKFLRFLIPGLLFCLIWFLLRNPTKLESNINDEQCKTQEEVKKQYFNGILLIKYEDPKKKGLRTFKYIASKDTILNRIFYYEDSDFFEYIQTGDSITKIKGTLEFIVSRNGHDSLYVLNYRCKE